MFQDFNAFQMTKLTRFYYFCAGHKYWLALGLFIIIAGVVDENSFWNIFKANQRINELNTDIASYRRQYNRDSTRLRKLETNPSEVRNIARERYFMKAENEDVYVIDEE